MERGTLSEREDCVPLPDGNHYYVTTKFPLRGLEGGRARDMQHQHRHHHLQALLEGIVAHTAGSVILDVTGVPVVDEEVASSIVRTATAARLLGASVILTGVQPEMARTLVSMGADLRGVENEGTLESGIARAAAPGGAGRRQAAIDGR